MYIPYEKIGYFINLFLKNERIRAFFYDKKVSQNLKYIEKNKPNVIKKLQQKLYNRQKIKVVFYVYDLAKWKCQSVYNIFDNDERFDVEILVTKSAAKNKENPTYQTDDYVRKTYKYFLDKKMNVKLAYDVKKSKFIAFKDFKPDIIFYQHPWYVETSQGPVVCSKFALTAYIPYYFPIEIKNIDNKIDYYLRFHKYVERYYALDKDIEEKLKSKMDNGGSNVKAVGYPFLDYFCNNNTSGDYIIYAPHWTIRDKGNSYGTFEWSGKFMLEYAKAHPEQNWIFKPHPLLFKTLIDSKFMSFVEAKNYYKEWEKIGIKYEGGEYLKLFNKSKLMITDSGSFYGEYFVTEKPVIMLMSDVSPFKTLENPILETYYCAKTVEELEYLIQKLPEKDLLKEKRLKMLSQLGLKNNNASYNIFCDILSTIGVEHDK